MRLGREKYFLEKLVIRIVAFKRIKKKGGGGGESRKSRGKRDVSIHVNNSSEHARRRQRFGRKRKLQNRVSGEEFSGFTRNLGQRFNFQPGPPPHDILLQFLFAIRGNDSNRIIEKNFEFPSKTSRTYEVHKYGGGVGKLERNSEIFAL